MFTRVNNYADGLKDKDHNGHILNRYFCMCATGTRLVWKTQLIMDRMVDERIGLSVGRPLLV